MKKENYESITEWFEKNIDKDALQICLSDNLNQQINGYNHNLNVQHIDNRKEFINKYNIFKPNDYNKVRL